jgi:SNF2 family DNA or RNA helicase
LTTETAEIAVPEPGPEPAAEPEDRQVLMIEQNLDNAGYVHDAPRRHAAIPLELPADLMGSTQMKAHQRGGFGWLVSAWTSGHAGVLLADDMGLGKTFQALAFLAWARANRRVPGQLTPLQRGPVLIVAPTALLNNRRQEFVQRFQSAPPGFDLLILSPKAAGIGLTIIAANHVIHLSRWWNPAVEDQCNDRCYRIGQDKPVTIHLPMAVHPELGQASFDCKLDHLLWRKRQLSHDMLAPPISNGDVGELFGATIDIG